MGNEIFYAMLERSQPPGSSIVCFDRGHRVTFISRQAERVSLALFGCKAATAKVLPPKLREVIAQLENGTTNGNGDSTKSVVFTAKDGSLIKPRLVRDPENTNHCLIFEQEVMISSPAELEFLGLSPRETEISFWIYQRKTTWEIGKILEVSPRTVEKHIENIFRKLELNGREDLVRKIRSGCGAA